MNDNNLICLIGLFLFLSCQSGVVSPQGYAKYLRREDNGLHQSIEIGDFRYELDYIPIEWQAIREIKTHFSQEKFDSVIKNYKGHVYLTLTVKMQGRKRIGDFVKNELSVMEMNKVRFSLAPKFKLRVGNNEYSCKLYHLEEMALAGTGLRFLLVFETEDMLRGNDDCIFSYQDDFFGKQKLELTFSKEDLQKIPVLKL